MAKANKKAVAKKSAKSAAPKKAVKSAKGAAPKKGMNFTKAAAPKKGMKFAKTAAPKKGMKSAKAAAPSKTMKSAKAAASKKTFKSAKAARPQGLKVAAMDQTTMLTELFIDHLKDIYWAEKAATKAMPRMRKAATSPELQNAFDQHLQVTTQQVSRLEQVFERMGKKAQGKKCDAMEGLIKETESAISETQKGSKTRDVALIIAAQKMEHYEIASYGGLAQLAKTMRLEEVKNLLGQTLEEEKQADELLTQIAENNINIEAEQEGEESEGEESSSEEETDLSDVSEETSKEAGDED